MIDRRMLQDAIFIDHEQPAQSDSCILEQHSVIASDGLVNVGDQRIIHAFDAAVRPFRIGPRLVCEFGIDGDADHFRVALFEVRETV